VLIYLTFLPKFNIFKKRTEVLLLATESAGGGPFFYVALLCCLMRASFFLIWIVQNPCDDLSLPGDQGDDIFLWVRNFLGIFPAGLFLTAFAFAVRTVSRIYHTITREELAKYNIFSTVLWALNFIIYILLLAWYCSPDGAARDFLQLIPVWTLVVVECFTAYFLFFYCTQLARQFPLLMRALYWASLLCFLSVGIIKPLLLILLEVYYHGVYHEWSLILYYIIAEIIPISLMVMVEQSGTSDNRLSLNRGSHITETEADFEHTVRAAPSRAASHSVVSMLDPILSADLANVQ